ncbi:MAG: type II secretion system F family protein, partial [Alphaproteobacteria bacterium]
VFYRAFLAPNPRADRLKSLARRRDELRAELGAPRRRAALRRPRERGLGLARHIVRRFNLVRGGHAEKAVLRLAQCGWRSRDALAVYLVAKLVLPALFGVAGLLVFQVFHLVTLAPMQGFFAVAALVVAGAYAPEIYLRNQRTKRQQAIQKGLPDALDLLVICAEAGQGLNAALDRVAREMAKSAPPLAEELTLTGIELNLLPERRQALENLAKRTDLAPVRGVVNTLLQSEKYGTPLAQSLRVLAGEFRNERMMRAETKAARLPAILTVPMIIFILPPLFIVLIGPAILRAVDMLGKM